jgi:hypothetical protein
LNAPIKKLTIHVSDEETARTAHEGKEDICGTCKVADFQVLTEKGSGREVKPFDVSFAAIYN